MAPYTMDGVPGVLGTPRASRAALPATLEWTGGADGCLRLLDETQLPERVSYKDCNTAEEVWEAIRELRVRGAPAIGVAAAYGLCLGTRPWRSAARGEFLAHAQQVAAYLNACRPTAVNLAWAIRRMLRVLGIGEEKAEARALPAADLKSPARPADAAGLWAALLEEADALAREDADVCRRIGEAGAHLVPDGGGVLTHCNAGALATVAYGTALSLLYVAQARGVRFRVFADETRPLLQGARLTAFELAAAGLDTTVLCDGAAASLLRSGQVQLVVVGADRIAANGDTANKIGTYGVALAARRHRVPFYVAAPRSTFDLALQSGADIPIEMRPEEEVCTILGQRCVPAGVRAYNPAFDITPAELISGIVTESGIIQPVEPARILQMFHADFRS